jgi:glutamyl/glutaminyl-tRNA synthetase
MNRLGDFVIAKADRTPAYQLAVVVDDAEMGATHVVRGDDLLDSTPRQILLYRALGLADRIPSGGIRTGPSISATARESFTAGRFAGWNTKRRSF